MVEICPHGQIWHVAPAFVIHGRSKERSDAAPTRGSMPERSRAATVQNNRRLCHRLFWTVAFFV
ncbi:hypothetical protein FJ420_28820 [Mesorhizobium sp. B3-1-3]|nr:hypothetical protein FJ424_22580 [Mesorhizobium sp. B3-1-8]TPI62699.1 hypothetical protein FJ417_06500 [Mesorhizobium sp. B3-1-7]TPI63103.1 hypothetical protein FJ420_28820 [Mesorhizobium sp. B3-1-3]